MQGIENRKSFQAPAVPVAYFLLIVVSCAYLSTKVFAQDSDLEALSQVSSVAWRYYESGEPDLAFDTLFSIGSEGHELAQVILCCRVFEGASVDAKLEEFLQWLRTEAEEGNAEAQFKLGCIYVAGFGVNVDHGEAQKWFTKAAEQGSAKSLCWLGTMYYFGKGVRQDYGEALDLYMQSAKMGCALAECYIAGMYNGRYGIPRDVDKTMTCTLRAADKKIPKALNNLAFLYDRGIGVPRDIERAVELWTESANMGLAAAQKALGMIYYEEPSMTHNESEAYVWFKLAAQVDKGQLALVKEVQVFMGAEDVRRAEELYQERKRSIRSSQLQQQMEEVRRTFPALWGEEVGS